MERFITWFVLIGGVCAIIGGMIWAARRSQGAPEISAAALDELKVDGHFSGNPAAKATLVEFSDFQCPACGAYYPLLKRLRSEFSSELAFVYVHFPLAQHVHAVIAARAAEAAGSQGKFLEMHDMLFERQAEWGGAQDPASLFASYAEELHLDKAKFAADLAAEDGLKKILQNQAKGLGFGINSTPTFFLNGKRLTNPSNYDEFRNLIQTAVNAAP